MTNANISQTLSAILQTLKETKQEMADLNKKSGHCGPEPQQLGSDSSK